MRIVKPCFILCKINHTQTAHITFVSSTIDFAVQSINRMNDIGNNILIFRNISFGIISLKSHPERVIGSIDNVQTHLGGNQNYLLGKGVCRTANNTSVCSEIGCSVQNKIIYFYFEGISDFSIMINFYENIKISDLKAASDLNPTPTVLVCPLSVICETSISDSLDF